MTRKLNLLFTLALLIIYFNLKSHSWAKEFVGNIVPSELTQKLSFKTRYGEAQFYIHYLPQQKRLVDLLLKQLPKTTNEMVDYFKYQPEGVTHIVIRSRRFSNGEAVVFPYNIIYLNDWAPNQRDYLFSRYDNWWESLFVHELAHILHLDRSEGFFKGLRTVLGSSAKWHSILPRWFIEGIGVWAESRFSSGGRANSEELEKELYLLLERGDICLTIDCLGEAKSYPGKRWAYWIGGQFLNHLERAKQGTISCLTEHGARLFPGFLRQAFERCGVEDLDSSLGDFLTSTHQNLAKKFQKTPSTGKDSSSLIAKGQFPKNAATSFGTQVMKDNLISMSRGKWTDEINIFSLKTGRWQSYLAPNRIGYIPTQSISFREKVFFPLVDPVRDRFVWCAFDLQKKNWEKGSLNLSSYRWFQFTKGQGGLGLIQASNKFKVVSFNSQYKETILFSFEADKYLLNPIRITGGGSYSWALIVRDLLSRPKAQWKAIVFNLDDEGKLGEFQSIELGRHQNLNFFSCPSFISATDNLGRSFSLDGQGHWQQVGQKLINVRDSIALNAQTELALGQKRNFEIRKRDFCVLTKLAKKNVEKEKFEEKNQPVVSTKAPVKSAVIKAENYFGPRYLQPKYWAILFDANDYFRIDLVTHGEDPLKRHLVAPKLQYYPEIKKLGGSFQYAFDKTPFYFSLDVERNYFSNSISESFNLGQSAGASFFYRWKQEPRYLTGPQVSYSDTQDWLGSRKVSRVTWAHRLTLFPNSLGKLSALVDLSYYVPNGRSSFLGHKFKLKAESKRQNFSWSSFASFGRMYSKKRTDGVYYGGANPVWGGNQFFEFVGVFYSELYGREIGTAGLNGKLHLLDFYRGSGLTPIFIKEIGLMGGLQVAYSERAIFKNRVWRYKKLGAVYIGPELTTSLFYLFPVTWQLHYAHTMDEDGRSQGDFRFRFFSRYLF